MGRVGGHPCTLRFDRIESMVEPSWADTSAVRAGPRATALAVAVEIQLRDSQATSGHCACGTCRGCSAGGTTGQSKRALEHGLLRKGEGAIYKTVNVRRQIPQKNLIQINNTHAHTTARMPGNKAVNHKAARVDGWKQDGRSRTVTSPDHAQGHHSCHMMST